MITECIATDCEELTEDGLLCKYHLRKHQNRCQKLLQGAQKSFSCEKGTRVAVRNENALESDSAA